MFPEVNGAINMATFLIKNPGNFKSETVAFPAIIALIKLVTSLIVEIGSILLFMYINNELYLIKLYAQLAIIGAIESKMAAIMTTRNLSGEMSAKPLQYPVKNKAGNSVVAAAWVFLTDPKGKNPLWVNFLDKLLMLLLSFIIAPFDIFYTTVYYYLIMFLPLLEVMISANFRRYPPDIPASETFRQKPATS